MAPKTPGGIAGGRPTRRVVSDRRGLGSKAGRATGRSPPSSSDRTGTATEAVAETYRRIPQVGHFVSKMVCRSTESWSSRTYNGRVHLWVRGACGPVRLWLPRGDELSAVVGLCASKADFGNEEEFL